MPSPPLVIAIVAGLISLVSFGLFLFQVTIAEAQVVLLLGLILFSIVGGLIWYFVKDRARKKLRGVGIDFGMDNCQTFAEEWWQKKTRGSERIERIEGQGSEIYYDEKERLYGYKFNRMPYGEKAGLPLSIIVATSPLRVVHWNDQPDSYEQNDPFFYFSRGFSGKPTRYASAEQDAQFMKYKYGGRKPTTSINIKTEESDFFGKRKDENT